MNSQLVTRRSSWWKRNQERLTPFLFLLPAMLFFTVYVIIPIFQSIYISLFEWDGLSPASYIGFANYVELFDDAEFYTSLWNNVRWLTSI
mgnify:CR=1 FL=1